MSTIDDKFEPQAGSSNFLKFTSGKHRFRILAPSISGYSWWEQQPEGGEKPKRIPMTGHPPVEYADKIKKFLAFPVWNYPMKRIQVLELTIASLQKEMKDLDKDPDWGDLTEYDLEVTRTGTTRNDTRYSLTPKPKTELSPEVLKAIQKNGLPVLEALYDSEDPFKAVRKEDKEAEEKRQASKPQPQKTEDISEEDEEAIDKKLPWEKEQEEDESEEGES